MSKKRLGYSSLSDQFARKGNPWMTNKESAKEFNYNPQSPFFNPDLDQFTKATRATAKAKGPKEKPIQPKSDKPSFSRRIANIAQSIRKKNKVIKVPEGRVNLPVPPVVAKKRYQGPLK